MTNLQAAIGVAQMENFEELVESRIRHAMYYNSLLREVEGLVLPPHTNGIKNVYWMYGLLLEKEFGKSRDQLRVELAKRGIETRTFFVPIHLQPIYYNDYKLEQFPISEEFCQKGLYLPSSSSLTDSEIEYITESIKDIFRMKK